MPVDLTNMREKYSKKPDSRGIYRFPAGGRDIMILCDIIENLEQIIIRLQSEIKK